MTDTNPTEPPSTPISGDQDAPDGPDYGETSSSWARRLAGAATIAALAVGAYTGYWLFASHQLRGGIDGWIAERAAAGLTVTYGGLEIDGFPFWLTVRLENPAALWIGDAPIEWRAPSIQASARPWDLRNIDIDFGGRHEVSGPRRVTVTARQLSAKLILGARGAVNAHFEGAGIDAGFSRAGNLRLATLAWDINWLGDVGKTNTAPPIRFDVGLDGLVLPPAWSSPLGGDVESFRLTGHVSGPIGHPDDPAALRRWRDAGGTIEVARLAADHGPARLRTSGTLALDTNLQPVGAFTAHVEGFMDVVDALTRARVIKVGNATAIKLVLTVVAKRPAGKTPYIEAPLSIQNRMLSFEKMRILKLPRIDWSQLLGREIS